MERACPSRRCCGAAMGTGIDGSVVPVLGAKSPSSGAAAFAKLNEQFGGLSHTEDFIEGRNAKAEGRPPSTTASRRARVPGDRCLRPRRPRATSRGTCTPVPTSWRITGLSVRAAATRMGQSEYRCCFTDLAERPGSSTPIRLAKAERGPPDCRSFLAGADAGLNPVAEALVHVAPVSEGAL